ncbi:MAG: hypothetical protein JM58_18100 [Peptococcaceae bacterium BICA1-8]|nr:MAG: hypothetical protein JM58_18100 [Peptococcaceae bacterium BICA1-8]
MDIEKIAQLLQNLSPVTIKPQLCSKVITPKSTCTNCQNICPVNSITFTRIGLKVDQCISCGLCIEACPNHVFRLNESKLLDINSKENPTLIITCSLLHHKLEKKLHPFVTQIGCLGELYPELLVYLLTSFSKILLIHDSENCKSCLAKSLEEKVNINKYANVFNTDFTSKLQIIKNLDDLKPYLGTQQVQHAHDRRSFFKSIFNGSKNMSRQILDSALNQQNSNKKDKVQPLKRYYLSEALKKQENLELSALLPYPQLKINACNFCSACSKLCPTNAIKIIQEDENKIITFTPNLCTHCHVCSDVCFFQGLSWGQNLTVGEFLDDKPQLLASAAQKTCENCEQDYYDLNDKNNLCFLCRPVQDVF